MKITNEILVDQFSGYHSFQLSWLYNQFISDPSKILALFTGNRYGKTFTAARNYIDRMLGRHKVPRKNVLYFRCGLTENGSPIGHEFSPVQMRQMFPHVGHMIALDNTEQHDTKELCPVCSEPIHEVKRTDRVFRFASAALPMQGEDIYHRKKGALARHQEQSGEVKNNQHPAFKKLFPPYLIKKDCTTRSPTIRTDDVYGRGDIVVEFTSYKQTLVEKTGQNRMSIWYDEQTSEDEFSDGKARVIFEKGDVVVTCTPIDFISFYFNEIFEQAQTIYRTKTIIDFLKEEEGILYPSIHKMDSNKSIAVFWAATDDNPLIDKREIPDLLMSHDDPIMNKIKRYGLFKQISGRIFSKYSNELHSYEGEKVFNPFAPVYQSQ